jgi:ABC-type nickel/cobalt efflux system permease component RcnA|tara:strand:+ start:376 stop:1116 length:741 start_codon:yes stop_codon:yes gene_type:complete
MEEKLAELGLMAALGLGVVLGLRHSLDPDHVVAVSTIVGEYRNPMKAFWVGVSWGFGHTTTLFLLGVVIITLRLTIPDRLALLLEFAVGIMLVGLGAQVIYNFRKKKVHRHRHGHVEKAHLHYHSHAQEPEPAQGHHQTLGIGKPFLRKKSYFVGMAQGMAGTAALTLLVLASIESPITGIIYLLLFGVGSVLSMGLMTILIGLPFVFSANRLPNLNRFIQFSVGAVSILFGFGLMYQIAFVEGLF